MTRAAAVMGLAFLVLAGTAGAATIHITSDSHWDAGTYASTNNDPPPAGFQDAIHLSQGIVTQFDFIWVACSGRGTAVRIDTNTGTVLGEYRTAPAGMGTNPSRTTVDANGDVWVGNRNEMGWVPAGAAQNTVGMSMGSVVKISASATGPNTSTGLGDIKDWTNSGGADTYGGTSTAVDPAILNYVRVPGTGVRTMAIDANNDLWTGGRSNFAHQLIDGDTGTFVSGESFDINHGGYGGLVDGNGVLWSASIDTNSLVRYDPAVGTPVAIPLGRYSYGLGIDTFGNIWNSNYTWNTITKLAPDGTILGVYGTGGASGDRGVAVTPADNNVWVANSGGNNVSRLDNNGKLLAVITVGSMPTGVSVDSNGKVWVTNHNSNSVMRIDPTTNLVDLTVSLGPGATPYNYSDMTGTVLYSSTIRSGTWTRTLDSGSALNVWDHIFWNEEAAGFIPVDGSITIEARLPGGVWMPYLSGDALGLAGRYLEIKATLMRGASPNALSPVLSDIRVTNSVIPEPSTVALLGLGLAGVLGYGWRRRRRS
jgi:YVTN family beta-propeller protein